MNIQNALGALWKEGQTLLSFYFSKSQHRNVILSLYFSRNETISLKVISSRRPFLT